MEPIVVNRFKPYRKMRWYRSNYLWQETNPYLEQYGITVNHGSSAPCDVLAIPCPHIPGQEAFVHKDNGLWIEQGHRGEFDYADTPMVCDSSMDYAYMDPPMRDLLNHPQVRAYLPGATFRDTTVQQRRCWGGEYYGSVYQQRRLYDTGPDVREERDPLTPEASAKIQNLNRPPTPPFTDSVFEYIASRVKPLKDRPIDLFFSGRTLYHPDRDRSHVTDHRKRLEELWPRLPGKNKVFKSYDDFAGTRKAGRTIQVYQYPYDYVDALLQSKVVVSPWGWSPWCVRDLEALACGCIVVKPECGNLMIYPDIYDPRRQLMVWCDIMYVHLRLQLDYIYSELDEMQERADRGRQFVTDALYPNAKLYAQWTRDLRRVLESALERPAYSQASQIPFPYKN